MLVEIDPGEWIAHYSTHPDALAAPRGIWRVADVAEFIPDIVATPQPATAPTAPT